MRCIDLSSRFTPLARCTLVLALFTGCSSPMPPMPPTPAPGQRSSPVATIPSTARPALPAPHSSARNWDEYRIHAAHRMVLANPQMAHTGVVVEPLLAIPVLEIELNGDGSIRSIKVMREPRQAKDTIQLAIDAVRRAGPFGDVSALPKPWRFSEVFLFGDDRRFKPRSLDH